MDNLVGFGNPGTGYADNHVNKEVAEKLSMDLPNNMGIVPYGEEGTMLYVVTKPSNSENRDDIEAFSWFFDHIHQNIEHFE